MVPGNSRMKSDRKAAPDLPTQLESLLDIVWRCERTWKLEDRIDGATGERRSNGSLPRSRHQSRGGS